MGAGLVNGGRLKALLESGRRVDFIGLGDSNQAYNGLGWDHGIQYGLYTAGYTPYGTGMLCPAAAIDPGWRAGRLLDSSTVMPFSGSYAVDLGTDDPNEDGSDGFNTLDDLYLPRSISYPASSNFVALRAYQWHSSKLIASGSSPANACIFLDLAAPVLLTTTSSTLRGHCWYGKYPTAGDGLLRLEWRDSAGTTHGSVLDVDTEDAGFSLSVVETTHDITTPSSYSGGPTQLQFRFVPLSGATDRLRGLASLWYMRVTQPSRTGGWAYSNWYAKAGQTSGGCYTELNALGSSYHQWWFQQVCGAQSGNRAAVFQIQFGLNDVSGAVTKAAYKANIQNLIALIRTNWIAAGFNESDCYFLLLVAHPYSTTGDTAPYNGENALLQDYRDASEELAAADGNIISIDMTAYYTGDQMISNAYYDGGGSVQAHLSQAGYEALGLAIANDIEAQDPSGGDVPGQTGGRRVFRRLTSVMKR